MRDLKDVLKSCEFEKARYMVSLFNECCLSIPSYHWFCRIKQGVLLALRTRTDNGFGSVQAPNWMELMVSAMSFILHNMVIWWYMIWVWMIPDELMFYNFSLFQILFLADLVNCHVVSASSLLALFDNFVEVCLEDNIPQVSWREFLY